MPKNNGAVLKYIMPIADSAFFSRKRILSEASRLQGNLNGYSVNITFGFRF